MTFNEFNIVNFDSQSIVNAGDEAAIVWMIFYERFNSSAFLKRQ